MLHHAPTPAYVNASGTVYAPEETKGGVLSTFKQKVKLTKTIHDCLDYTVSDKRFIYTSFC